MERIDRTDEALFRRTAPKEWATFKIVELVNFSPGHDEGRLAACSVVTKQGDEWSTHILVRKDDSTTYPWMLWQGNYNLADQAAATEDARDRRP